MRVVTLLPGATEMVCAVGGADLLVGVSHECDHPADVVAALPRVTVTPVDTSQAGGAIDRAVRDLQAAGRPVIGVDADALRALRPDLLVTQSLCEVCAVADGTAMQVAKALDPAPRVLALGGRTATGVQADLRAVGEALGLAAEGAAAARRLADRLEALALSGPRPRPRVLCLEWLDPPYTAGHWVPDLVHAAGGTDVAARTGEHSAPRTWAELGALDFDLVLVMPCGLDVARARIELERVTAPEARAVLERAPVWLLDGNAFTSRPGPRLADGAERLRAAFEGREGPDGLARWR